MSDVPYDHFDAWKERRPEVGALAVKCPYCMQLPGFVCINQGDRREGLKHPHRERVALAKASP